VSGGDVGDQACGRAGKDRGDHGDHSGDRLVDQAAPAAEALDGNPPRWRDAGQVVSELWRMVKVVSPEPRDPFDVFKLFDSVLEHPVKGGEADEGERRQQYQGEGIERRADAGRGGDQPESDQSRGYRAEEDRCPAYPSADCRAPRSLEGEMLRGDKRYCRRRRLICAVWPGSRVFSATIIPPALPLVPPALQVTWTVLCGPVGRGQVRRERAVSIRSREEDYSVHRSA